MNTDKRGNWISIAVANADDPPAAQTPGKPSVFICVHLWFQGFFRSSMRRTKRSKSTAISCGPGLASGWPWKLYAGLSR